MNSREKINQTSQKPIQEKELAKWQAPLRPFERKSREFYTTAGSIIFLICVILLFIKEFLFIFAIIAFAFFYYVITSVVPEKVEHRITNKGIKYLSQFYNWSDLGRFWFDKQMGQKVLLIENFIGLPPRLLLVLASQKEENLKKILKQYLNYEKPEKTRIDRMSNWLAQKVPLEDTSKK